MTWNAWNFLFAVVFHESRLLFFPVAVFAITFTVNAQQKIDIDLAGDVIQEMPKKPGAYVIEFYNAIPKRTYLIEIGGVEKDVERDIPPLSSPDGTRRNQRPCSAITKLSDASSEQDVSEALNSSYDGCNENDTQKIKKFKAKTKFKSRPFDLPAGSSRTIIVNRKKLETSDNDIKKTWMITVTSGSRGKWQTTFGWMFTANRDEDYFTEPVDNGKFRIVPQKRSPNSLTSLPSIFWHWLPAGQAHKKLQHGPTAGVGISIGEDASRPAVFGGYSIRYRQNIGIVSGVGVYSRRVLNGRYGEGAVVASDLESSQLTENANHFMFFAGVTFRVNFAKLFGQGNDGPSGE